jgi:hypothetical protein
MNFGCSLRGLAALPILAACSSNGSPSSPSAPAGSGTNGTNSASSAPVSGVLGGAPFSPAQTTILGSAPALLLLSGDGTACSKTATNSKMIFFQVDDARLQTSGVYDNVVVNFDPDPMAQTGNQSGHLEVLTPLDPNDPASVGVFRVRASVDGSNHVEGQFTAKRCH